MSAVLTCQIKCLFQDCMFVAPPKPWHDDPDSFDVKSELSKAWPIRPDLFFHCQIRPLNPDGTMCERADRDIPLQLMFFSRFLKCCLTPDHPLTKAGHQMVYEPSPQPVVHVGHIGHALCRVPLMPCFLELNSNYPTLAQSFNRNQARKFKHGQADTRTTTGSNLYEINQWMLTYGRPKLREMSYEESQEEKKRKFEETIKVRRVSRKRTQALKKKHSFAGLLSSTEINENSDEIDPEGGEAHSEPE